MFQLIRALVVLTIWGGSAAALAQSLIYDEFQTGELNWIIWCPCQINMIAAPITFPLDQDQAGDRVAQVTVNKALVGGNNCKRKHPDECRPPVGSAALTLFDVGEEIDSVLDLPEPLGPSLIRPPGVGLLEASRKNPYCTDEVKRRAEAAKAAGEEGGCIQRQELRFQTDHRHDIDEPGLYSFRFRMPEKIENRTDSIRWVIAQWKHKASKEHYCKQFGGPFECKGEDGWGPSPFLALRFDDGVLHVSVQDEHCRCVVASAPLPNDRPNFVWVNGPVQAQHCLSTKPGDPKGTMCTPDLDVQYGEDPILSAPRGRWVEMQFRVEAGRSGGAIIEIREGDRPIVRVAGKIGYVHAPGDVPQTKFKIGHYRGYMPFEHVMEIDWLKLAPVSLTKMFMP